MMSCNDGDTNLIKRVRQRKGLLKEQDCGGDDNLQVRGRDRVKMLVVVFGVYVCDRDIEVMVVMLEDHHTTTTTNHLPSPSSVTIITTHCSSFLCLTLTFKKSKPTLVSLSDFNYYHPHHHDY